jgi:hypothetical protein
METAKALMLVEKKCYIVFINRHYGNPPLETTTLDCIAADRQLPCSLCLSRSQKSLTFVAPPSAIELAPLIAPSNPRSSTHAASKKLRLTKKERALALVALKKFRNELRVELQFQTLFRNHPPSLFLAPSILDSLLDGLLSFSSTSDLQPILQNWYHNETHSHSLYDVITEIQKKIQRRREHARLERNRKAREKRQSTKRKALPEDDSEEEDDDYSVHDDEQPPDDSDEPQSDSSLPAALLPTQKSRPKKRQALDTLTNLPGRRTRAPAPSAADVSKNYRPQYRPRTRN